MDVKVPEIMISEDLVPYLYTIKEGDTIEDKANIIMVIGMFASKVLTLEKAAELVGESVWEFIDLLKKYQIPWGEYTRDTAQMDEIALKKLDGGFYG